MLALALLGTLASASALYWGQGIVPGIPRGASSRASAHGPAPSRPRRVDVPIHFEANEGQAPAHVRFLANARGSSLSLTSQSAILSVMRGGEAPGRLVMSFPGSNPQVLPEGLARVKGVSNYLIGDDPAAWLRGVLNYSEVQYREIYPRTNLVFHGKEQRFEYDFHVSPGGDPGAIRLSFEGQGALSIGAGGALQISIGSIQLTQPPPRAFQRIRGRIVKVHAAYRLSAGGSVRFALGGYDRARALVIDPVVAYSTYLGGSGGDSGKGIAVDPSGNAYIGGDTGSPNFPEAGGFPSSGCTGTACPINHCTLGGGCRYAFVAKLSPDGQDLIYASYVGGSNNNEGSGVAVDGAGRAYLTGFTYSKNFPGMHRPPYGPPQTDTAPEAYVARLTAKGDGVEFATLYGGSSGRNDSWIIALDAEGRAWTAGTTLSHDFPTTVGAFEQVCPCNDVLDPELWSWIAGVNPDGTLAYSTYLGSVGSLAYLPGRVLGSGQTATQFSDAIAPGPAGHIYVAGLTGAPDFPTTPGAYHEEDGNGGFFRGFLLVLNPAGHGAGDLVYSTLVPARGSNPKDGSDSYFTAVAVDQSGNAYMTGGSDAGGFPTTPGAYRTSRPCTQNNCQAAVAVKMFPGGQKSKDMIYSTYLYSSLGSGINTDAEGGAYIAGSVDASDYPMLMKGTALGPQGGRDALIIRLNPAGSDIYYSTTLGGTGQDFANGIFLDSTGIYVTGFTDSTDFYTAKPVQSTERGRGPQCSGRTCPNAFVTKIPSPVVGGLIPNNGPETGGTQVTVLGAGLDETSEVDLEDVPPASAPGLIPLPPLPVGAPVPPPPPAISVKAHPCPPAGGSGDHPCFSQVSSNQLVVFTPTHPPGVVNVIVKTTWGPSLKSQADLFTYLPLGPYVPPSHQGAPAPPPVVSNLVQVVPGFPSITGVDPDHGPVRGGDKVIITGKSLKDTLAVLFGDVVVTQHPCPPGGGSGTDPCFTQESESRITSYNPAHEAGEVHVQVATGYGASPLTPADLFDYISDPPAVAAPAVPEPAAAPQDNGPGGTPSLPGGAPGYVTVPSVGTVGVSQAVASQASSAASAGSPSSAGSGVPGMAPGAMPQLVSVPGLQQSEGVEAAPQEGGSYLMSRRSWGVPAALAAGELGLGLLMCLVCTQAPAWRRERARPAPQIAR